MEVKLGTHVYTIVSVTPPTKTLRIFLELLLHSSNLLMVACMEVKRPQTESNDFFGGLPPFMCSIIIAHAYKNERRLVNKKSYGLKKGEHIGMV